MTIFHFGYDEFATRIAPILQDNVSILFKMANNNDLTLLLFYIKIIVDSNEEPSRRYSAKVKLNYLLDTYQ